MLQDERQRAQLAARVFRILYRIVEDDHGSSEPIERRRHPQFARRALAVELGIIQNVRPSLQAPGQRVSDESTRLGHVVVARDEEAVQNSVVI